MNALGADGPTPVRAVIADLVAAGQTVAVAESLTGGQVCAGLVDVPGASAAVLGGVIAYATPLKHRLLGVDADLLATRGAVDPEVAVQMARGVRDRLGADWGCSTTGVAGPRPQDGRPVGRVYVAVVGPAAERVLELDLPGDRAAVRRGSTERVIRLLADMLAETGRPGTPGLLGPL